jgi:hypothetical protein
VRRFASVAVLALAAAAGAVPCAVGASALPRSAHGAVGTGSIGLRLLDVPVASAYDPRARQYIVDHLEPGTVIHRRIELWNGTASPLRVAVYPDAARIANGSFIGASGHAVNDLVTWTSVSRPGLEIPAGGYARDTVTIAVPRDAPPGERYGVIWAEVAGPGTGNITLVTRIGTRVYLSIGGANAPASNFTVNTLTAQRGADHRAAVEAMVHNTGGRALDLTGTLTLSEAIGGVRSTAGPYAVQLGTTLAPGQSEPVRTVVTDPLGDGPWDATIELKSGLVDETYQARITFPHDTGSAEPVAARPESGARHLALITGAGTISGLLGVAAVPVTRHRRRRAKDLGGS